MMAALSSQMEKDERAVKLAALSITNTKNMEHLEHSADLDSLVDEMEYQRDVLAECSTNEANECALVALAFATSDGNERAELAALAQEEPLQDERAAMAALSHEAQGIERAETAALSHQQKELHTNVAVPVERACVAAHQAQEEFRTTLIHDDVDNFGHYGGSLDGVDLDLVAAEREHEVELGSLD